MEVDVKYKHRTSKFINYFDKTPEGVYCPHFWVLAHANTKNCPMNCQYCFARLTFRRQNPDVIIYTNYRDIIKQTSAWINKTQKPSVLNAGEYCDFFIRTLVNSREKLADKLIPLFRKQSKQKLLILTKTNKIKSLLDIEPTDSVIVSASINCERNAKEFERNAPPPIKRISALLKLQEQGWKDIRVRIDPGVFTPDWNDHYSSLLTTIHEIGLSPTRFTLGTLRFFGGVKGCWEIVKKYRLKVEKCEEDGRYRLVDRVKFYKFMIPLIQDLFPSAEFGLCKETEKTYAMLNMNPEDSKCNCTL